jgi:hypothetical protein
MDDPFSSMQNPARRAERYRQVAAEYSEPRGIATCIGLDMERAYRIRPCTIIDFRGAKPPLGRLFLGGFFRLTGLFAPICF